jgi:hypothetical protein
MSGFSNANYLPRPHHDLSAIKQRSTQKPIVETPLKPVRTDEPVPDMNFYTRANFYKL